MGLPMMPPTETTFSCWVSRLKPSMAAVVFARLVVGDDEVEPPPLPAPLHASRPVDLVHGERRPGTHLDTPWHEVGSTWSKWRDHADLDRAPLGGPARPAVRARPAQRGGEHRYGAHGRNQSIPLHDHPSFRHACRTTRLATTRRSRPAEPVSKTPTRPPVLSMSPTTHRSGSCANRDNSQRLDERVARTSAHVYNTRCVESSKRSDRAAKCPVFAYKRG